MENGKKDCFCRLFTNIPVSSFSNSIIIDSIIKKNFKKDKNGNLFCRKCGRIVTDKEIKERARKIPSIVW